MLMVRTHLPPTYSIVWPDRSNCSSWAVWFIQCWWWEPTYHQHTALYDQTDQTAQVNWAVWFIQLVCSWWEPMHLLSTCCIVWTWHHGTRSTIHLCILKVIKYCHC